MVCDLGKKQMIIDHASVALRMLGFVDGQLVRVENILPYMNQLDTIADSFGIGLIQGNISNPSNVVRIKITVPDDLIQVVDDTGINPEKYKFRFRNNFREDLRADIESKFNTRFPELRQKTQEALLQLTDISRLTKAIEELPSSIKAEMSSIRRLLTNLNAGDYQDSVDAYTAYLLEASVVANEILKEMSRVKDDPEVFVLHMNLHSIIASYSPILNSLRPYMTQDSPLYDVVNDALAYVNQAETLFIQTALQYSLDNYDSLFLKSVRKMEEALKERIDSLDKQIALTSSATQKEAYEKKKKELMEEFEKDAPTRENIRKTLMGERGDINYVTSLIRAGMANPDWIVSGFMEKVNQIMNDTARFLTNKREDFAVALKESGIQPGIDVQNAFKDLIQTYDHYFFDGKAIQKVTKAALMSEYTLDYLTTHSYYEAQLDELRARALNGEDVIQEKEALVKEFRDWRIATYESKYTQEYYDTDALLDQVIDGRTVREYRDEIVQKLSQIQSEIRYNGFFPTSEQLRKKRELVSELRKLKSFNGKEPGSTEYMVAQVLQEHAGKMATMTRYEMTAQAQANFNRALTDVKNKLKTNQITKEEHDLWMDANTRDTYSPVFFEKLAEIFDSMEDVKRRYSAYTGQPIKEVELWKTLRNESLPYRDDDGVIDASIMPADLRQNLIDIQKEYFDTILDDTTWNGLSKREQIQLTSLYKQKSDIYAELSENNTPELKKIYEDIKEEIASIESKKITDGYISGLKDELNSLKEELAELSTSRPTAYYRSEYQRQLDLFIAGTNSVPNADFSYEGFTYTMFEDGWIGKSKYEVVDMSDSEIMFAWRGYQESKFKESKWYQDNHIKVQTYDPNEKVYVESYMIPYVWSHTKPKDENYILKNEPSFHWQERIITALNPNYSRDIKNRPVPKVKEPNLRYPTDPKKIAYLQFLTSEYLKAQKSVPVSQCMGLDLPSIERSMNLVDSLLNIRERPLLEQISREFFTNEQDKDEAYGDTTNRMIQYQPMMFSGTLEANLINMNLHETILRYVGQAHKYENIQNNVIPLASATEAVLSQHSPTTDVMNKGAARLGFLKKLSKPADDNARLKVFREMVNTFVYNEQEYGSEGVTITENTIILGKFKSLVGKNVRFEKVFNKLLGFRAASLMFGSVWPQIPNLMNGIFQQIIQSAAGKGRLSFTTRQWFNAWKDFNTTFAAQYVVDMHKPGSKSKFTLMMDYFNAIPLDILNTVGYELDQSGIRKAMSTDLGFFIKNSVEFSLSATTFLAMAKSWYYDGKPLWDFFDVVNGKLEMVGNIPVEEMDKFIKALNAANRDINGNYAKLDKTIAEKFWFGRAVFFMKKFIVPFVERRYSRRRYSNEYETYIEGYHRTAFRMMLDMVKGFLSGAGARHLPTVYNSMTDAEKAGVKMFLAEMFILTTLIVTASLLYDDEDEDRFKDLEKSSFAYQVFLYSLLKTKSEVETFIVPFGINEIDKLKGRALDELFPTLSQFVEIVKSVDFDEMEFKKYKVSTPTADKGDLVITHKLMKLLGWNYGKFDPVVGIRNYEQTQR